MSMNEILLSTFYAVPKYLGIRTSSILSTSLSGERLKYLIVILYHYLDDPCFTSLP